MDDCPSSVQRFTDLPEDDLALVFGACHRPALGNIGCVCHDLRSAVMAADHAWRVALARDFDIDIGDTDGQAGSSRLRSLDMYRRLVLSSYDRRDLTVSGFFTDGGIDDIHLVEDTASSIAAVAERLEEGASAVLRAPPFASEMWVSNAFEPSIKCFSSDVAPGGGAAANVTLMGRVTGVQSTAERERRASEMAHRAFLCERLRPIATQLFGWPATGFGSVDTAATDDLEAAVPTSLPCFSLAFACSPALPPPALLPAREALQLRLQPVRAHTPSVPHSPPGGMFTGPSGPSGIPRPAPTWFNRKREARGGETAGGDGGGGHPPSPALGSLLGDLPAARCAAPCISTWPYKHISL